MGDISKRECVSVFKGNNTKNLFPILIIIMFLGINFVSAQPPALQDHSFTTGYEIKVPAFGVLPQSQNFKFYFHVFNISNGVPVSRANTSCQFHLYNTSGDHQYENHNLTNDIGHGVVNEWEADVSGTNFSVIGDYSYVIQCNSTTLGLGGFESVEFEVTPTGTILKTSDSNTYTLLTLASLFFFLLCLWGGLTLPFKNNRDEDDGKVSSIQKLKYFKVGLIFLSYVFLMWLLNLLLALSTNFSVLTQYTKFFEVIFSVMNTMSFPIFVLMLIVMSILAWKDLALNKLLTRGISPD